MVQIRRGWRQVVRHLCVRQKGGGGLMELVGWRQNAKRDETKGKKVNGRPFSGEVRQTYYTDMCLCDWKFHNRLVPVLCEGYCTNNRLRLPALLFCPSLQGSQRKKKVAFPTMKPATPTLV